MFSTQCGWLRYDPHHRFVLPRIVQVVAHPGEEHEEPVKVPLCDSKTGNVRWTKKLYKLEWPGALRDGEAPKADHWDMIPASILGNLPGFEHVRQYAKVPPPDGTRYSLAMLIKENEDQLPTELPPSMAYHLAVNRAFYYPEANKGKTDKKATFTELEAILKGSVRHPVAGLPADRVAQTLDARFALDSNALSTLSHLKWQAEAWRENPAMSGFDTMIRDGLYKVCWTMVQTYFWLLGDYIYDFDKKYWERSDWKYHWWQMAGYMFWIGRTGAGVVDKLAGMGHDRLTSVERFEKECPDIVRRMSEWQEEHHGRNLAHVTGKEPGGEAVGPSLGD